MPTAITLYRKIVAEKKAGRRNPTTTLARLDTPMPDRVDQHPAGAYLIGTQTTTSRRTARSALNTIVQLLGEEDIRSTPWHKLDYGEMNVLRTIVADNYAPATANKLLSIVRGVLREAWKLGMMDTDTYKRAVSVPHVPGTRLPAGRALEAAEVRALFDACAQRGPQAARDAALLAILLGCGLRRGEASALDLDDLDRTQLTLRVIGKGNRERLAHMNGGVHTAVNAWLQFRGNAAGPLLYAVNSTGNRVIARRLQTESMRLILQRRGRQAGIRSCTPHDLRRTFITNLLDAGNDIAVASRMAGHQNISTTTRYDRRDESTNRDAAATVHVPYQPPPGQGGAADAFDDRGRQLAC